jgi:hypothetical protein
MAPARIIDTEQPIHLCLDQPDDIRDRHPLHRVVLHEASGVERWLKVDAEDRWVAVAHPKANDVVNFVLVNAAFDRRHQHYLAVDPGYANQRSQFFIQDVWVADVGSGTIWCLHAHRLPLRHQPSVPRSQTLIP